MDPAAPDEPDEHGEHGERGALPERSLSPAVRAEHPAVTGLCAAIDRLVAERPAADGGVLVELVRQLHRLQAMVDAATADFATSGDWAVDGARSAATWVAERCRIPKATAKRSVGLGKAADDLQVATDAWMAGDVGPAHVAALAAYLRPGTRDALIRDEAMLVEHARNLGYGAFRQALAYWEQHVDPDGCEEQAEARRARRDVRLSTSFEGICLGTITLDAAGGAIVMGELRRIEQALFEADWADAKELAGDDDGLEHRLARTPAQRRADALVEMATRSRSAPPGARRPAPLLTVLVDYPTLAGRVCELADGTVLTPGELLPWITQADVERAVFGPDRRVEVGETTRFFRGATRRAIEIRDRVCSHPLCDETAAWCEVDHIVPWEAGGRTCQQNGRLLCRFHHRMRQERPPPFALRD
jgi:hypothetical protein